MRNKNEIWIHYDANRAVYSFDKDSQGADELREFCSDYAQDYPQLLPKTEDKVPNQYIRIEYFHFKKGKYKINDLGIDHYTMYYHWYDRYLNRKGIYQKEKDVMVITFTGGFVPGGFGSFDQYGIEYSEVEEFHDVYKIAYSKSEAKIKIRKK